MAHLVLFLPFCHIFTLCFCQDYLFQTDPELDQESDPLQLFVVAENRSNVTVICKVTLWSDIQTYIQTYWELIESKEILTFYGEGVAVNHSYISARGDNHEELTISGFSEDVDRLQIGCRGAVNSTESVIITFGFLVGPTLLQASVYDAVEFSTFSLDLQAPSSNPFPPYVFESLWIYDDCPVDICQPDGIETGAYNITIDLITRDYAGMEFELRILETSQSVIFTLNILYEPEAQLTNIAALYASVGDTVTLTVATNITGNPTPTGLWRMDGADTPIELFGRYSSEFTGQLSIENVGVGDFDVFILTASNGIGEDIVLNVSLLETEPRFNLASVSSRNGGLSITWTIAHTGYEKNVTRVSIKIACGGASDNNELESSDELSYFCPGSCIDSSSSMGTGFLAGPVYAGSSYQCVLTAATVNGSGTYSINSFTPTSGIPSPPMLSVVVNDNGSITISVSSLYSGDIETFFFAVTVINETDFAFHNMSYEKDSASITLNLPAGMYFIDVAGYNKFGMSVERSTSVNVPAAKQTDPTDPTNSTNSTDPTNSTSGAGRLDEPLAISMIIFTAVLSLVMY